MTSLVVCRNSDVDEFQGGICVCQSNDRNVDIRRFADGLVVYSRVGDDDETWFFERTRDVVGK
jgi:hypothetical protein